MKVGFYEAEVTPLLGTGIPGYFFQRNAVAVKQRLYVKAMVVESGGAYAAVLGVDALALPFNFPERVRENVAKRIPIDPYSIAMGATHAHTSMPVRPDQYADDNVEEVAALMKIIVRRAADAIVLAYQRLQEADAFYAATAVNGIACVRNCVLKGGQIRTNPYDFLDQVVRTAAEPDPTLPLLLEWYDNDEREKDIPLLVIRIGEFALYSTPGEPFCDYAKQLRQLAPTDKTLMMQLSHIGYPVSYIPTPERFLPYVYESAYYSAGFEPETGDNMVKKLTEMAKSLF